MDFNVFLFNLCNAFQYGNVVCWAHTLGKQLNCCFKYVHVLTFKQLSEIVLWHNELCRKFSFLGETERVMTVAFIHVLGVQCIKTLVRWHIQHFTFLQKRLITSHFALSFPCLQTHFIRIWISTVLHNLCILG